MAAHWRHLLASDTTQTAAVKTFVITATSTGQTATWTLTLTDDAGDTHAVTYTEDSPYTDDIADGLVAAWNQSSNPHVSRITAAKTQTDTFTLTGPIGMPMSVALADDADGTHTETDTATSAGINDYGTATNWSGNAVPDIYDDVVFEKGQTHVLYGLDQSAVLVPSFTVARECRSNFGRYEFGQYRYLQVSTSEFTYRGNGALCLFDLGASAIAALIEAHGSPTAQGLPTVNLLGSALTTVEVTSGLVGIAAFPEETATVGTVLVGGDSQQGAFGSLLEVWIGSGVSLTTLKAATGRTHLRCAATTATCSAGAILITEGTGAIATLYAYGTTLPHSSGTITDLHVHGTCDMTGDRTPRTVTNCHVYPGATLIYPPEVTFTNGITPVLPADSDPRPIVLRPVA